MTPDEGNLTGKIGRMDSEGFDGLYREYKSSVYRFAYFLARNRSKIVGASVLIVARS